MRRATAALRALLVVLALAIGPEGAFVIGGTAALAIGASFISPAGPWFVVGVVGLLLGVALALPRRS